LPAIFFTIKYQKYFLNYLSGPHFMRAFSFKTGSNYRTLACGFCDNPLIIGRKHLSVAIKPASA